MKRFKFKLEPLLRLRRLREDQGKAALGQVAGQMRQLQGRLEECGQDLDQYRRSMQAGLVGVVQIESLVADRRYLDHLHLLKQKYRKQLEQVVTRFGQARVKLIQARKQTQIVLKLQDRAMGQYRRQFDRYYQQQLDQIGNDAAAKRTLAAG